MPYSFVIRATPLPSYPLSSWLLSPDPPYTCEQAQRACRPSFVFSIPGQVHFRKALHHLLHCRRRVCLKLSRQVIDGMQDKLQWLLRQNAFLGCIHIQPYLYGQTKIIFRPQRFAPVAHHLVHCPKESCAQLRRSILLTIRSRVRPPVMSTK